jgi:hypothetical protein
LQRRKTEYGLYRVDGIGRRDRKHKNELLSVDSEGTAIRFIVT